MFVVIFFAGTYFCGSLEKRQKSQKLEPAKISCHTAVPNTVFCIVFLWGDRVCTWWHFTQSIVNVRTSQELDFRLITTSKNNFGWNSHIPANALRFVLCLIILSCWKQQKSLVSLLFIYTYFGCDVMCNSFALCCQLWRAESSNGKEAAVKAATLLCWVTRCYFNVLQNYFFVQFHSCMMLGICSWQRIGVGVKKVLWKFVLAAVAVSTFWPTGARGPFLEMSGNVSGLKSNTQIKI